MFEKFIMSKKYSLVNISRGITNFISNTEVIPLEIFNYISGISKNRSMMKMYLHTDNKELFLKLILLCYEYFYDSSYLCKLETIFKNYYESRFLIHDKDSYISLKWLIDTLNQYTNMY